MDETSRAQEQFAEELARAHATIQAARLKEARTIITGISDAVTDTVVDLIDWTGTETVSNLQEGSWAALESVGIKLDRGKVQ